MFSITSLFLGLNGLAAPSMLSIEVKSQTELLVAWSNNNNNGSSKNFEICWKKVQETTEKCLRRRYSIPTPNATLSKLLPATKYEVTVAQNSDDGTTLAEKAYKIAITRSD